MEAWDSPINDHLTPTVTQNSKEDTLVVKRASAGITWYLVTWLYNDLTLEEKGKPLAKL